MTRAAEEIRYEFEQRPEPGEVMDIFPGLKWLRMPLPMVLGHINLWILEDGDGWTLVDTGMSVDRSHAIWEKLFRETLNGRPVKRVIVTHLHPDHTGCAGWLTERFNVELWMSREEYLLCRILVADTGQPAPPEGIRFYAAAGFSTDAMQRYKERFGEFGTVVSRLPQSSDVASRRDRGFVKCVQRTRDGARRVATQERATERPLLESAGSHHRSDCGPHHWRSTCRVSFARRTRFAQSKASHRSQQNGLRCNLHATGPLA